MQVSLYYFDLVLESIAKRLEPSWYSGINQIDVIIAFTRSCQFEFPYYNFFYICLIANIKHFDTLNMHLMKLIATLRRDLSFSLSVPESSSNRFSQFLSYRTIFGTNF